MSAGAGAPRGLLGPGDRKSLQPMAARLGLRGHDQLRRFAVLADAGHGASAAFRAGPSARGLAWAVGVPRVRNMHAATTVELPWPWGGHGTAAARAPGAEREEPAARGRVRGGAGAPGGRRAAPQGWPPPPHPPGEEVGLVGERRATGEKKCCLSNLPAEAPLAEPSATVKARRPSLPAVRGRLLASFSLPLARCPCRRADLRPAPPFKVPRWR